MIKEYRNKRGYTQEQLSELLHLSTRQLQRIEKDETRTSIDTLKRIRKILDIPDEVMVQLFYEKEDQKSKISS